MVSELSWIVGYPADVGELYGSINNWGTSQYTYVERGYRIFNSVSRISHFFKRGRHFSMKNGYLTTLFTAVSLSTVSGK